MWKAVEGAAIAVLFLCTAMLLVIRVSHVVVALSIRTLFVGAVVSGAAWYVLDAIGLL